MFVSALKTRLQTKKYSQKADGNSEHITPEERTSQRVWGAQKLLASASAPLRKEEEDSVGQWEWAMEALMEA